MIIIIHAPSTFTTGNIFLYTPGWELYDDITYLCCLCFGNWIFDVIFLYVRSIAVEDKSFGLGIMMLCGRLLGKSRD